MRSLVRAALITALTMLAAVGFAPPTLAHVKVSAIDAKPGGYGILTFRVPTESDTASTTELRVTLPDDSPIYFVITQAKPGWTATVTKMDLPAPRTDSRGKRRTQYVSQVDWKANSPQAAIPPNQFDTFSIDAGPLPNVASLTLPAEQFYSDGATVNWGEKTVAGAPTPKHPAAVLTLASGTDTTTTPATAPMWPAIVASVVATVALLVALASLMLLRRKKKLRYPAP